MTSAPLTGPRLWLVLASLAGMTAAALALCSCTALPPPECQLGSYLSKVDTDAAASGQASAAVGVLTQSGKGDGAGKASRSIDWTCKKICHAGQLLRASRSPQGMISVECSPGTPVPRCPGTGTSNLPPQGDQKP